MTRLILAALCLLAVGCGHPPALVVVDGAPAAIDPNQVATKKPRSWFSPRAPAMPRQNVALRDPDVVSELPTGSGMRAPAPVPSNSADDRPTVIARPPSDGSGDSPTPTGTN